MGENGAVSWEEFWGNCMFGDRFEAGEKLAAVPGRDASGLGTLDELAGFWGEGFACPDSGTGVVLVVGPDTGLSLEAGFATG